MKQIFMTPNFSVGAILIGENGQRRLAPFNSDICYLFETLETMTMAQHCSPSDNDEDRQKRVDLELLLTKTSNYLVGQIEAIVGPLNENAGIIYEGFESGFVCGSTGKPPVFVPQDEGRTSTVDDFLDSGIIDADLIEVIEACDEQGKSWIELFESPLEQAKGLGMVISDKTAADLKRLAPSKLHEIQDPDSREYLAFFHAVVADGRYLDSWQRQPAAVAAYLGIELSDSVLKKASQVPLSPPEQDAIAVLIPIIIVGLIAVTIGTKTAVVADRSGLDKF